MKKAFLVIGAESSGTKLVTQLLANHGCAGQNEVVDNDQVVLGAMEKNLPLDSDPIVVRLSVPHGLVTYDVEAFLWHLHCIGYDPLTIVTVRDWNANLHSQLHDNTYAFGKKHAMYKLEKAYKTIFKGLIATDAAYFMVNYEAIIARPKDYMNWIVWRCGLKFEEDKCPEVHDANEKWYK